MRAGDVLVRRASLFVSATSAEPAVRGLDALEVAIRAALSHVAEEIGSELVVVNSLELALQVVESGRQLVATDLQAELRRAICARLDAARTRSAESSITRQVARFASESVALAEYLRALVSGNAEHWPFRAFRDYGTTWDGVLSNCLARDRLLLADVLASVSRLLGSDETARQTSDELAVRIVAAWASSGSNGATGGIRLPDEISSSFRASARLSGSSSGANRRLSTLVQLFALWPPARALTFTGADLDELALARSSSGPAAERRASMAGGLVVLAKLFEECGLDRALVEAYPEQRVRRAVRWVVGRALETARLNARDPLLAMWAGESPGAVLAPLRVLADADPEPLHRLALGVALREKLLHELRLVPFGDEVVLLAAEQMVVDSVPAPDVHEAVPELVRRFALRCGQLPDELSVLRSASTSESDAIADIDTPSLPTSWQPSVRAGAAVARALLFRRWKARLHDVRGWTAIAVNEDEIELRGSDAARVLAGEWLRADGVMLGERARRVKLARAR
jgi:hypothetical protein